MWLAAGDEGSIRIGDRSNIQDNSTIQSNKSFLGEHNGSTSIGDSVTVGHGVFMDSVTIEDEALVGMGATLLQGVKVMSLHKHAIYCCHSLNNISSARWIHQLSDPMRCAAVRVGRTILTNHVMTQDKAIVGMHLPCPGSESTGHSSGLLGFP